MNKAMNIPIEAKGTFWGYLEQSKDEGQVTLHLIEPDVEGVNVRKKCVFWLLSWSTGMPHVDRQM